MSSLRQRRLRSIGRAAIALITYDLLVVFAQLLPHHVKFEADLLRAARAHLSGARCSGMYPFCVFRIFLSELFVAILTRHPSQCVCIDPLRV